MPEMRNMEVVDDNNNNLDMKDNEGSDSSNGNEG